MRIIAWIPRSFPQNSLKTLKRSANQSTQDPFGMLARTTVIHGCVYFGGSEVHLRCTSLANPVVPSWDNSSLRATGQQCRVERKGVSATEPTDVRTHLKWNVRWQIVYRLKEGRIY